MFTVYACAYGETDYGSILASIYAQGAEGERMAGYLVGTASQFNIHSPILLALGELEDGGPGKS